MCSHGSSNWESFLGRPFTGDVLESVSKDRLQPLKYPAGPERAGRSPQAPDILFGGELDGLGTMKTRADCEIRNQGLTVPKRLPQLRSSQAGTGQPQHADFYSTMAISRNRYVSRKTNDRCYISSTMKPGGAEPLTVAEALLSVLRCPRRNNVQLRTRADRLVSDRFPPRTLND